MVRLLAMIEGVAARIKIFGLKDQIVGGFTAFHGEFPNGSFMTFCKRDRLRGFEELLRHPARVFLTDFHPDSEQSRLLEGAGKTVVYAEFPRQLLGHFAGFFEKPKIGLRSLLHNGSMILVGDNVSIEPSALIGEGTEIHSHVTIYAGVRIGQRCRISAGCVIGAEGFGYERQVTGGWVRIPHIGGVRIGNNVEIGGNTCIDRGTLADTVIEDGVKIDNLVHIAHNVLVGRDTLVIANSMIAGSVRIGERVWVGPGTSIREQLVIGSDSKIGMGSVVVKDVRPNTLVYGVPARESEESGQR